MDDSCLLLHKYMVHTHTVYIQIVYIHLVYLYTYVILTDNPKTRMVENLNLNFAILLFWLI